MAQFSLQDFKKQASFFLRDRFKDARLALTDVSRIQLLAEEATNEDPWGPETKRMAILADAAFELDEYERITLVIRNRLDGSNQKPWQLYKTLALLEYILIRGPVSIWKDFRGDILLLEELSVSDFMDEQGIDRGTMVHKTLDRVLELLNNPDFWKEERIRAKKLSFGIQGFGNNVNQVPSLEDTQGDNESSGKGVTLVKKLSKDEVNAEKLCKVLSDKPSSVSNQAGHQKQVGYTKEPKVSPQGFKKSFSTLGYIKEKLPYRSWQTVPDEVGLHDEEVGVSLLDEEEDKEGLSGQEIQVKATEQACQLVAC